MGLEIKQSVKMVQQLVMTPQLQQAIKLLQLSRLELTETINQELMENPMLEQEEENRLDRPKDAPDAVEQLQATAEAPVTEVADVAEQEKLADDFDWDGYLSEYSSGPSGDERVVYEEREAPSYDNMLSKPPSLDEHLLWQLHMAELDEWEVLLGALIIGNLDGDGYLKADASEVIAAAREQNGQPLPEGEPLPPSKEELAAFEKVLGVIQQLDPLGVGARSLQECLKIQAVAIYPGHDLVHDILDHHLEDLEYRRYKNITKKLSVTMDEVAEALEVIRHLDPKPGRTVSDEEPRYITPDLYLEKVDGEWVITLNEDGLPRLKVNNFYKQAIAEEGESEAKEYVRNKLRSALWLIRSIHQRQRTLYKVMESILKFQMDFFNKGVAYLKPLVLRDVAEDVSMHESTISRVTTSKYVHSPRGVFELKYFFNSGIKTAEGGSIASEAVKERIKQLVGEEPAHKPLSDQAIADILKREGLDIARRTVAKYREMLGILPSSRRRQPLGKKK